MGIADTLYDALIIGAGPAGCSCATWLKQLGYTPLLIDNRATCGGIQLQNAYMNTWIASSPATVGRDVAAVMHANVAALGVAHSLETTAADARRIDGIFHVRITRGGTAATVRGRYLVLAGGIVPRDGGFAAGNGVFIGSTPAVAAADMRGKRVAILGGGDNAFENYSFFRRDGAQAVTIFSRGTPRARRHMVESVPKEDIITGSFTCDTQNKTVNGRAFDYIIIMFGYDVAAAALLGLKPELKPDGYIMTDTDCRTSLEHVFAIGEIAQRMHPCCVTAMADGVVAAKAIERELEDVRDGKV